MQPHGALGAGAVADAARAEVARVAQRDLGELERRVESMRARQASSSGGTLAPIGELLPPPPLQPASATPSTAMAGERTGRGIASMVAHQAGAGNGRWRGPLRAV
jgi:hypothetical protein